MKRKLGRKRVVLLTSPGLHHAGKPYLLTNDRELRARNVLCPMTNFHNRSGHRIDSHQTKTRLPAHLEACFEIRLSLDPTVSLEENVRCEMAFS